MCFDTSSSFPRIRQKAKKKKKNFYNSCVQYLLKEL